MHPLLNKKATVKEKSKNLKQFKKPIPIREVSLVHSRTFLKEGIVDALEHIITSLIPIELASLKRDKVKLIDI